MVALKSLLLAAVALTASLVAATDNRRLIDVRSPSAAFVGIVQTQLTSRSFLWTQLPDLTSTCKIWNAECAS